MKKQSKMIIGITAGAMLVAVIVIVVVLMASGSDSKRYAKHMEAAQRYMDELDYEQAIAEYRAAIEIEPNNVEAYQALAELYVQTGDYESAIEVLNQGIEQMSSAELTDDLEEVQNAWEEMKDERSASQAEMGREQENGKELQSQQETSRAETQDLGEFAEENGAREEVFYTGDGSYLVYEYDGNGNCVKETNYNAGGTSDYCWVYEYDGNGNLVKSTFIHYGAEGTLQYYTIGEYDEYGNCVKNTYYNADGTPEYYLIAERDGDGNCVKETFYNADGTLKVLEYDGNRIVKQTFYNEDGTLGSYIIYEYDRSGNLSKRAHYNADGSVIRVEEF